MNKINRLACIALSVIVLTGCSYMNKKVGLQDDNFVEELSECVLESYIGAEKGSLDFTPSTPEE